MSALSRTQNRVLTAIKTHIAETRRAPSSREVAKRAGLSPSYTYRVIKRLEAKGRITSEPYKHYSITITTPPASS